ncbi:MAG: DUF438 domain-containing protein [Bacteroidales bacterium]|nr:DUF438 domain-containing protein [Bacteroidales bacterium]
MSELINNSNKRKELLKHMILQLHEGEAPEQVKKRLADLLQSIPYGEVVEVEQELINEGLPESEVLKLCDIHGQVLEGHIDQTGSKQAPEGHPVDTFLKENQELKKITGELQGLLSALSQVDDASFASFLLELKKRFNQLYDVDKHYRRKENLLFPYLEKYEITGPPKVMWGKHDEIRELLKASIEVLNTKGLDKDELQPAIDLVLKAGVTGVEEMIMKEEQILLPMCMDTLSELEWYEIYQQTNEIGYCLYDPQIEWNPEGVELTKDTSAKEDVIQLPSGSFTPDELNALLNSLPIDMTFVDKNDKVKYFSQGKHRIFDRNRAILGRDVRLCHPPSSVNIVDQIVDDFKSGKQESAPFWIQMGDKFVHIEYFAMRDKQGDYLGTLEVSQELTELRALEGEQRLLNYSKKKYDGK